MAPWTVDSRRIIPTLSGTLGPRASAGCLECAGHQHRDVHGVQQLLAEAEAVHTICLICGDLKHDRPGSTEMGKTLHFGVLQLYVNDKQARVTSREPGSRAYIPIVYAFQ